MDKQQAQNIIRETFESSFDKSGFTGFIKNLLNRIDDAPFTYQGNYIPDAYKQYIKTLERIGKFSDGENSIDILVITLQKETSLERARTMQRNFIAWYLNGSRGGEMKDAALAAFVSPVEEDWRFSLVKMDYKFEKTKTGRMKVREEFTPARRWSFLVGENEKSHTAQSRLVDILANDEKAPTLEEIENRFDIETVTKEFFLKYRELFMRTKEELDRVIKKDPKVEADFESKGVDTVNFAKKLLGQIIFLYFLQKKGWFGVGRDDDWGTGSKNFLRELFDKKHGDYKNFFNDILEPLFYEALRTGQEREHEDYYYSRFNCKIPFLNGGLFDPIGNYDWVHTDIIIPDRLFSNTKKTKEGDTGDGILDIFDRYNFTVKEDEPLEREVAIDPELLGKAYEKFNAIRPDNYNEFSKALKSGKTGEENKFNKKFGVYYTPREIVHYMCQQSLINYLATELEGKASKEDIESLIHTGEQASENEIAALIKEQNIIEGKQKTSRYKLQLPESIRNNAALIDEKLADINVCDPAVGSGAFPVGMMSEIVRARNVLSMFVKDKNRASYEFKRRCIEHSLYGVDIDPGAVEIAKLRLWLSLVVDEDDIKNIKPLPNLDYKVVCGNSLLGVKKDLFNAHLFSELEKLKPLFFNETNPTKKQKYKKQIDELIREITNGHTEFDFEVYFSEVFHHKSGFDVVLANPPYVQIKQIPWDDRKVFVKKFKSAVGRFNLFYFFLEISSNILRPSGFSTYIVPDRLLLNTQCDKLRKWLLQEQTILEIDSFIKGVFQAVVDNIIIFYCNNRSQKNNISVKNNVDIENIKNISAFEIPITYFFNSPSNQFDLSYDPKITNLINKIKSNSLSLESISETKDGIIQGKVSDKLFLDMPLDKDSKPLLFGEDINRYSIRFRNKWVNYKPNEIMRLEVKRRGPGVRHGLWMRTPVIFERNKILTRQTADEIIAAYDTDYFYYSNTLHGTTITNSKYNPLYVLALLNSTLMTWYYRSTTAEEGKVFAQIKIDLLRKLPVKETSDTEQQCIIKIVEHIISITQSDDYLQNQQKQAKVKAFEAEIDQLVYKLYDLTLEEIKIVEGKGENTD
ncbi:MAG: Eco57I restriction-modification methylase domain-containing protein [Deltaproteobacteria bacterium]|nr:Eco57I restriction-modification methylase domain-containing protein [Deltaproteobacteria bacterium]